MKKAVKKHHFHAKKVMTVGEFRKLTPKASKFMNKKVVIDGITFDSKKEASRYLHLKELETNGHITSLELQKPIKIELNGVKVCKYIADFCYVKNGLKIIEDVKSEFTRKNPVYRLKKKLVLAFHGIEILEV